MRTIVDRFRRISISEPFTVFEVALLCVVALAVLATSFPEWVADNLSSTPWLVVAPLFALVLLTRTVWELRDVTRHTVTLPGTPIGALRTLWRAAETVVSIVLVGVASVAVIVTVTGLNIESVRAGLTLWLAVVYVVSGYAILPLLTGRLAGSLAYRLLARMVDRTET